MAAGLIPACLFFAGAAAEFALNKGGRLAVFFTGRLPADPLGRLFSHCRLLPGKLFFPGTRQKALHAIDQITAIHRNVEKKRDAKIPDSAYRDVLFLLIAYSISGFELLDRKLSEVEKTEIFNVFYRVGTRVQLESLPVNYAEWEVMRQEHLDQNLVRSVFTDDLYRQYKKQLGPVRYVILKQVQQQLVPAGIKNALLPIGRNLCW